MPIVNISFKILGILFFGLSQLTYSVTKAPIRSAGQFVGGYKECLVLLGSLGHSQKRVADLAHKLNKRFPFTNGHSHHSRELKVITESPDKTIFVFKLSAHRYHAMRGEPGSELIFLYNSKTDQWIDLEGGDLNAYDRKYHWYPSNKGMLIATQNRFSPPHRIEWFDGWPMDMAGSYKKTYAERNSTIMKDPSTGEVVGIRAHPESSSQDTPFKMKDSYSPIRSGSTSWLPNGKAFLEFNDNNVSLVHINDENGIVKFSTTLTLSYKDAVNLKKASPNGRAILGDSDLNEMREGLKSLELVPQR